MERLTNCKVSIMGQVSSRNIVTGVEVSAPNGIPVGSKVEEGLINDTNMETTIVIPVVDALLSVFKIFIDWRIYKETLRREANTSLGQILTEISHIGDIMELLDPLLQSVRASLHVQSQKPSRERHPQYKLLVGHFQFQRSTCFETFYFLLAFYFFFFLIHILE